MMKIKPEIARMEITEGEHQMLPRGCRCSRAFNWRRGVWRLIDTHDCPYHLTVLPEPHTHQASGDLPCWCSDPQHERPPLMRSDQA